MQLDKCSDNEPPVIVLGEDKVLNLILKNKKHCTPSQKYVDISTASEIEAIFLNADASFLELKLSLSQIIITNGPFGEFSIILNAAQTALLQPSSLLNDWPERDRHCALSDIQLNVTISGKTSIYNLRGVIRVVPKLYPTAP